MKNLMKLAAAIFAAAALTTATATADTNIVVGKGELGSFTEGEVSYLDAMSVEEMRELVAVAVRDSELPKNTLVPVYTIPADK